MKLGAADIAAMKLGALDVAKAYLGAVEAYNAAGASGISFIDSTSAIGTDILDISTLDIQAGDLGVLQFTTSVGTAYSDNGFTERAAPTGVGSSRHFILTKVMDGAETALDLGAGDSQTLSFLLFRGASYASVSVAAGSSTSLDAPAVTVAVGDVSVVLGYYQRGAEPALPAPSGYTLATQPRISTQVAGTSYKAITAAGSEDPAGVTITSSDWDAVTMRLSPA